MHEKCSCGRAITLSPETRVRIRDFLSRYPWVRQKDLARLFNISQSRISEIIRADELRGGK